MSNEEYHAAPGLSKSSLDLVNKSINHLIHRDTVRVETPAMILGTAVHSAVLEPLTWPDGYMRGPEVDKRNKAWTEAKEKADDAGIVLIDPADYDKVETMAERVFEYDDQVIRAIAHGDGIAEGSLFVKHPATGMLLKCRPDYLLPKQQIVVDLKTTMDASPEGFARSCGKYRYDIQEALYTHCLQEHYGGNWKFVFLAVENRPPFNVGVYTLGEESLIAAHQQFNSDIRKYVNWHEGYDPSTTYSPERQMIEIPRYCRRNN